VKSKHGYRTQRQEHCYHRSWSFRAGGRKVRAIFIYSPRTTLRLKLSRYLLSEKTFDRIDIFEQQSHVGGVWHSTPALRKASIPQFDPLQPVEEPSWQTVSKSASLDGQATDEPIFVSPLYDHLETNPPKVLMQYSDTPFPNDCQLFPKHETVTNYLEDYAMEVKNLIFFETQVQDV
jgi:cation diffusion facilitator CzcD-associated flavoprotein CzcO